MILVDGMGRGWLGGEKGGEKKPPFFPHAASFRDLPPD
jgi:hypothetical protein